MKVVLSALLVVSLTGCATYHPDVIHPYEAQRMSHLSDATVLSVRPVTIDGMQTGVGASVGAIAGGVAAANAASYHNAGWAGLLGAVVGGLFGNAVERSATTQNGVELLLQMRNGERRSIVQANGNEGWMVGEPVVLVTTGGRTRVTRAPQVGAQPVPQAYPAPQAYPVPQAMPAPVPVYPQSGPVPPRS
jgi:outer membrane lipoprotein SlyB